jgi:CPA1 family monovalent cation:H+ antiporter
MDVAQLVFVVLIATAAFGLLARRLRVPDAIVLVIAGLGVGFVPGLPHPRLAPELVFLLVLPPLLFSQAWFSSWREFWAWKRPIFMLAFGLVLFTTAMVGLALHWLEPRIPLALCFAFGAIVSPPDAVAASAIAQAFRLPHRMVTILEGESLVNDATALVAYRFALAAATTGRFELDAAAGRFLVVALGGIALGLAVGWLFAQLLQRVRDDSIVIALTLVAPYAAWLASEPLQVSGVLAVVTAGIWLGARGSELLTANARVKGFGFWSTLVFLLNGAVFLLIGLQLPVVLAGARDQCASRPFVLAAAVFAVTVVVRLAWVFPGAYLPRLLSRGIREREPAPGWQAVTILGWAGMRGVVSLAAAMALPLELAPGVPLPMRDLLIFLTFSVILGTLVVQGLTLPLLIKWLGFGRLAPQDDEEMERAARLATATAALQRLRARSAADVADEVVDAEALALVIAEYEDRVRLLHAGRASLVGEPVSERRLVGSLVLRRAALAAERLTLLDRHRRRDLTKELLVRLERELDLEESRLDGGGGA